MKTRDWFVVVAMISLGIALFCIAVRGMVLEEVMCLGRGCKRQILLALEPGYFYFNIGGLLILASVLIWTAVRIVLRGRR